ncbi:hypothetical protein OC861_002967 [Tilletia horrida]|nr:hypothetical protein OC861_002967 [Tilletia horrida]
MASSPAAKVLVVGPPAGQLRVFLSKTNAIHDKHGPFDALFVLGNLFAPPSLSSSTHEDELNQLLNGTLACKIPTYFTLGTAPLPQPVLRKIEEDSEASAPTRIASNLFYLGSSGVTTIPAAASPHPLNVAFIGGQWNPQTWSKAPLFNDPNPAAEESESQSNPITPRQLHTLLAHPSLALSKPPSPRVKPPKRKKNDIMAELDDAGDQPMTLAEARAQQAAKLAALTAASSAPTGPSLPSVAAGLTVEDETEAPTRPAIDILLLPYFPANILKPPHQSGGDERKGGKRKAPDPAPLDLASLPHPTMPSWGAAPLATLTARARARYVFALGPGRLSPSEDVVSIPGLEDEDERRQVGTFFERAPFYHPASAQQSSSNARKPITRFISLANLANPKKVRWFMALNLPLGPQQAPVPMPENVTSSPYGMLGFERTEKDLARGRGDASGNNPNMQRLGTGAGSKHSNGGSAAAEDGSNPNFRFSTSQRGMQQVPPRGYICRLCSRPGHFIQDCELATTSKTNENGQGQNGGANGASAAAAAAPGSSIVPPPGYECRICLSPTHLVKRCPFNPSAERNGDGTARPTKKQRRDSGAAGPRAIPVGPADCWFCLSNPACAKHLIVGIGSECYLSLPKGQLTPAPAEGTIRKAGIVPGGGHVLIILSEADRNKLLSERTDYLRALSALYATHGAFPLSWEIGRSEGSTGTRVGHTQTQVVPVPLNLRKGLEEVLHAKANEAGYEFLSGEAAEEVLAGKKGADYFRMQIGVDPAPGAEDRGGQESVSFVLLLRGPQGRFSIQWPRQTLATILNTPERADWRFCARETAEEEREEAEAFKAAFQPFAGGVGDDDSDEDEDDEVDEDGEGPDAEGY